MLKIESVGLVDFTADQIRQVAEHLGMTGVHLREHMASQFRPREIDEAFHYITGCYPFRVVPAEDRVVSVESAGGETAGEMPDPFEPKL